MCNAGQCIVELNGSIRTHVHLSFAFLVDAMPMPWIMSKTSGKQSAYSLDLPEDEVGDLFCLGWIHAEVLANLFNILDGLLEINEAVVTYHRDDVGSVNFWLSIDVAANDVDLLDEVHVLFLCVRAFTLKRWPPIVVESGLQPEYLASRWSFMLRNEVEVRIHFEDG